ncbi:Putative LptC-related OstA-like protein [Candidatus Bealeia paramacronuclearis]|uniref:LptC-related OstA-like protein n=1 Tax=Candidatus Bealeia paramacronuclearis TaxID=1921001 RepID=A0ABZ2C3Q5_9PROT|nr:putative LptC-related OstA-like protein [Candidatus Bealeia paramacronuclearis]
MNYSRAIFILKIALPLAGVFMLSLVFLWPYLENQILESTEFANLSHPDVVENRMLHPRFMSTDENGRPFELGAHWGKQLTENQAQLTSPHGKMTNAKGIEVDLKSNAGTYANDQKAVDLTGDVVLTTSDGYKVQTEAAHIDINTQTVDGNVPVQGEGPMGSLKSQNGFTVVERADESGKILTLKGKSQVIINSKAAKEN